MSSTTPAQTKPTGDSASTKANPDDALPPYSNTPIFATCHCKGISLLLPSPPTRINECLCSICYRYGALWAYYPSGFVQVTAELGVSTRKYIRSSDKDKDKDKHGKAKADHGPDPEGKPQEYGHIEFHFCSKCGCMTHWWPTEAGKKYLVEVEGRPVPREEDGGWKMGVNGRMMEEKVLAGVEKEVNRC